MAQRMSGHRLLRKFARNEEGVIAILFALLLVPMLGVVFASIDYGRANRLKAVLVKAADAAAFTAASRLIEGRDKARTAFAASFRANLPKDLKDIPYQFQIGSSQKKVSVTLNARIPTTLVKFFGLNEIPVNVEAEASQPKRMLARPAAPAEVKDALDESGVRLPPEVSRALERGLQGQRLPQVRGGQLPDEAELRRQMREVESKLRSLQFHLN